MQIAKTTMMKMIKTSYMLPAQERFTNLAYFVKMRLAR